LVFLILYSCIYSRRYIFDTKTVRRKYRFDECAYEVHKHVVAYLILVRNTRYHETALPFYLSNYNGQVSFVFVCLKKQL